MEQEDNELLTLELIHRYVELLDKYFGSVSLLYTFSSLFTNQKYLELAAPHGFTHFNKFWDKNVVLAM